MPRVIHARLDPTTVEMLHELQRRLGWSDSKVVSEGIKILSGVMGGKGRGRIVGLGRFRSGIPDLGSNKEHLKEFGR
jgi:hypothetical protein